MINEKASLTLILFSAWYQSRKAQFFSLLYLSLTLFPSHCHATSMAGDSEPPSTLPVINPQSPFYLGAGDRPDDFITSTQLTHDNYDAWVADIQMALEARCKFDFLDDIITHAKPPYAMADWTTVNAMLVS